MSRSATVLRPKFAFAGEYVEQPNIIDAEAIVACAMIASAIPVEPPREWFGNPGLKGPTPITVDDNGRVFGHIAAWQVAHIGLPFNTKPPRSRTNYQYFNKGALRCDDGKDVTVGQLTLAGGHAGLEMSAAETIRHYDDTNTAVADVHAGEDMFGIWVAGALRPNVTPIQIRALRASTPSGDWRPISGRLELVAVLQVNVPGFPVARTMVASSGYITALVAAGAAAIAQLRGPTIDERLERIERALTVNAPDRTEHADHEVRVSPGDQDTDFAARAAELSARVNARRTPGTDPELSAARAALSARVHGAELKAIAAAARQRVYEASDSEELAGNDNLENYWKHGKGAAKIRWGTHGDFTRCDSHLSKHVGPERAKRICAQWHHDMDGYWPGDKKNLSDEDIQTLAASARQRVEAVVEDDTEAALFADYSTEKREEYAKKGWALPSGAYPIANKADLARAIRAYGRASKEEKPQVRRLIMRRARGLGRTADIPPTWLSVSIEERHADLAATIREMRYASPEPASEAASAPAPDELADLSAPELFAQVAALVYKPSAEDRFVDKLHPRDDAGKFRDVLLRLKKDVQGQPGADAAIQEIDAAQAANDTNNDTETKSRVGNIVKIVDQVAIDTADPNTAKTLRDGYRELGKFVAGTDLPAGIDADKMRYTDLPPETQSLIDTLLGKLETYVNKETYDKATGDLMNFKRGGDVWNSGELMSSLTRILRFLMGTGSSDVQVKHDAEVRKNAP